MKMLDYKGAIALVTVLSVGLSSAFEPTTSFRTLFSRMPQLRLSAPPNRVLINYTDVEGCARECVRQTAFDCRSFDVDNQHRACLLFNTTHEDGRAFLQESSAVDHYRTAFEKLFKRLPNHVLTLKHNRRIQGVSAEQCARRCVFEQSFRCAGFDYEPGYANCWLTDLTMAESKTGVKFQQGADYYERDFGGALANFISYGSGSLPFVDDRVVYSKTMYGVDLGACAQVCLSQTSFECASFDYTFVDKLCQMSRYVAANVGGIDNEKMITNRVVHFEKKGIHLERFHATPFSAVLGENDKKLERVNPERCAKACLEETTFVCRSFDYQIKDGSCMLSRKTGSDVGKLSNQGMAQVHHFELKPSLDCGGALTQIEGDFASPGWPRNYSHYLNCTWTIRVPKHKVIMFTFLHFDLGPKSINPCSIEGDRLRIEESTTHGDIRFCATPPMTTYISQTNVVNFNLQTNAYGDAQGFKVVFKGDWPCRAVLREDRGEIASPQWPEQYPPGLTCAWSIQAPTNGKISLKFTTIDLDGGHAFGACTELHDAVTVYDGSSSNDTVLGRFCQHEDPEIIISSSSYLLVTFKSDTYMQRTGFHASYDFLLPTTTAPPTTINALSTESDFLAYGLDNKDRVDLLSAKFVEPTQRRDQSSVNISLGNEFNFGVHGGEFLQPSSRSGDGDSDVIGTETYITILWTLLISLFLLAIVLTLVLIVVCRHNKKRVEKRQAAEKYLNKEEGNPLYDTAPPKPFEDDESLRDYLQEDIAFSNPLYQNRRCQNHPSMRSELTLASEVISDSGCSSSTAPSSMGQQGSTLRLTSPC